MCKHSDSPTKKEMAECIESLLEIIYKAPYVHSEYYYDRLDTMIYKAPYVHSEYYYDRLDTIIEPARETLRRYYKKASKV